MGNGIYSAIDANINRTLEGLKICEDVYRFIYHETRLAGRIKEIRHDFIKEVRVFPDTPLLNARDVESDQLKFIDLESERRRDSLEELVKRNLHRSIEALRAIEEFTKLLDIQLIHNPFQRIRFSLYNLEKELISNILKVRKIEKLKNSLYAILDSSLIHDEGYSQTASRLIDGGARVIQLRMKSVPVKSVLSVAKEISAICRERRVLFIINDYPDIARISNADGVHLGQDDLPLKDARLILPPDMLIGISTHTFPQAMIAYEEGADYIALGPIYDTRSKYDQLLKGIEMEVVRDLVEKINIPIVCIGGLEPEGVSWLKGLGYSSFALISYLYRDNAIEENCRRIIASM
ncbi:MAG: thiamine phosphate synthase [Spirochaetota bacterium]|nr:thiamine phosphate synthase [Spirochaetota bacterium]